MLSGHYRNRRRRRWPVRAATGGQVLDPVVDILLLSMGDTKGARSLVLATGVRGGARHRRHRSAYRQRRIGMEPRGARRTPTVVDPRGARRTPTAVHHGAMEMPNSTAAASATAGPNHHAVAEKALAKARERAWYSEFPRSVETNTMERVDQMIAAQRELTEGARVRRFLFLRRRNARHVRPAERCMDQRQSARSPALLIMTTLEFAL